MLSLTVRVDFWAYYHLQALIRTLLQATTVVTMLNSMRAGIDAERMRLAIDNGKIPSPQRIGTAAGNYIGYDFDMLHPFNSVNEM